MTISPIQIRKATEKHIRQIKAIAAQKSGIFIVMPQVTGRFIGYMRREIDGAIAFLERNTICS